MNRGRLLSTLKIHGPDERGFSPLRSLIEFMQLVMKIQESTEASLHCRRMQPAFEEHSVPRPRYSPGVALIVLQIQAACATMHCKLHGADEGAFFSPRGCERCVRLCMR